jgi:hypothetical protein
MTESRQTEFPQTRKNSSYLNGIGQDVDAPKHGGTTVNAKLDFLGKATRSRAANIGRATSRQTAAVFQEGGIHAIAGLPLMDE